MPMTAIERTKKVAPIRKVLVVSLIAPANAHLGSSQDN